jgi:hypothetical protein
VKENVLCRASDEESIPSDKNVVDIVDLEYRWRVAFVPELNLFRNTELSMGTRMCASLLVQITFRKKSS